MAAVKEEKKEAQKQVVWTKEEKEKIKSHLKM